MRVVPDFKKTTGCHTAWLQDLYQCLSLDKTSGDEVPRGGAQNTRYVFTHLSHEKIHQVVERFGGKERFAMSPIPW